MAAETVLMGWKALPEKTKAELIKFEAYMQQVAAGKSHLEAYADVYGEVLYDELKACKEKK